MVRSTQEVFDHHRAAIETVNFEALLADYADNAILVTLDRVYVGKEGISSFFKWAFESFPHMTISFEKTAVADDTFLLQWSAEADNATVPHGIATFIIRDSLIQRQTEWMVIVPKEV